MTYIGNLLYQTRIEANLTQKQLGHKLGISAQYISNIERGLCVMEPKKMKKAARVLKVPQAKFVKAACDDYAVTLKGRMK